MTAPRYYTIEEAARHLGVGRNELFAKLRELKILNRNNIPYTLYEVRGLFTTKVTPYRDKNKKIVHVSVRALVTVNGLAYLKTIFGKGNAETQPKDGEKHASLATNTRGVANG